MSKVQTFLVIVYQYEGDLIRVTRTFADEDINRELEYAKFYGAPVRKEVHLVYPLYRPLTHEQLIKLEYMKQVGICTSFYVKDEIMADVEMPVLKEDL